MSSYKTVKLNSERPGSSAKAYENENSNYGLGEGSKIPKFPKRTYSLEGKKSTCCNRKSNAKQKVSTTSMIPRLEWKKQCKKQSTVVRPKISIKDNVTTKKVIIDEDQPQSDITNQFLIKDTPTKTITSRANSPPRRSLSSLEWKLNQDFLNFKDNVLKIPEYWTDAGQTATNILKNAISIVSKQYPTVEKESFDNEIQNILKATEAVKQQILTKTENIINRATQIYAERNETSQEDGEEELKKITNKMEELRSEVSIRKNVFGDLLKYGNEMKNLIELENALKQNSAQKKCKGIELQEEAQRITRSTGRSTTHDDENVTELKSVEIKKNKKGNGSKSARSPHSLRPCGDVLDTKMLSEISGKNSDQNKEQSEKKHKVTQTMIAWADDLEDKQKMLGDLNDQIIELQQLCKDHISKFKSFNLQIKLRGICNKAQHISVSKELQTLNDEKMQLQEKNSQLECYNKNLETAIKQKDLDLHQKDKLINQQKKLLQVRDELIEMLKSRCNLEESKRH